ncbi:hypothetical protein M9458_043802, partial [Cirrhinus mrigala]
PTLDPEPSQPSPRFAEHEPEPTVDGEPEPSTTDEPLPNGATVLRIHHIRPGARAGYVTVEREGAEESPAQCTIAKGERKLDLGLWYFEQDFIDFNEDMYADMPPLSHHHPNYPFTLNPLSTLTSLSRDSPTAHPQPTICAVGSPRVCQFPSASWLEDPSSPPPASNGSLPSPVGPPAPPGSLVSPAPSPQDSTPPAAPCRSIPPAPLGSSLPPAPPQSSVAPAPPRTSGAPEPWTLPWPSGSSVSPELVGSLSLPRAPPPLALPPS